MHERIINWNTKEKKPYLNETSFICNHCFQVYMCTWREMKVKGNVTQGLQTATFLLYLCRGQVCNKVSVFRKLYVVTLTVLALPQLQWGEARQSKEGKDLQWLKLGKEEGMWQPGKSRGKWEGSDSSSTGRRKEMEEDWERSVIVCVGWQEMKQEQMGGCKWERESSSSSQSQLQRGWNCSLCLIHSSFWLLLWEQGYLEHGLRKDLRCIFLCGNCHLFCSSWLGPSSPDRTSYVNWLRSEGTAPPLCLSHTLSLDQLAKELTSWWALQHLAKNT